MSDIGLMLRVASIAAATMLSGCNDAERNVILERSPFFEGTMPYKAGETTRIASAVRRFANQNGMDFRQGGDDGEGGYNLTAAGREINFKVIHTTAIEPSKITISVYALSSPNAAQQQRAREFACVVTGKCRQ